jgi:beta-lactamase class A
MSTNVAERPLAEHLAAICDAQPFRTSFAVRRLDTGEVIGRNADTPTPSASTRKISIMMAALKAVHEGRLDMDEPIALEERLKKDVASGTYRYMTAGTVMPLHDAITNMIITSDNVCTQMMLERLTLDEMNVFCRNLGLTNTRHMHLIPPIDMPPDHPVTAVTYTTPSDQMNLLQMIVDGTTDPAAAARLGSTPALCAHALEVLSWQQFREQIPALLPYGTRVCNKTGRGKRGRMDVGVVYRGPHPAYIITAFTDEVPEVMPDGLPGFAAAFRTVAMLSRACWDATTA